MSGLFNTFNIVKRGMFAQQTALNVTSHNISNANTEGYSVQRADLKTTKPFGMPSLTSSAEPGQLGTGVQVASITRSRDQFIDLQIRREKSTLGKYSSREEFLSEIETIFMEPSDTGLSKSMTEFWKGWHQLATTPESSTARELVVKNSETLANAINHNYEQLEKMQTNAGDIIKEQIFDTNSILNQIKEINVQIKAVVIGGKTPNDLMDRRDLLLDQLSERMSFETEETDFNGIMIKAKVIGANPSDIKERVVLTDGEVNSGISYISNIEWDNGANSWKAELYVGGEVNNTKTVSISDSEIGKYAETDANKNVKSYKTHTVFYDGQSTTLDGNANQPANLENGSLYGFETVSQDITKYKDNLNKLARALAISVNTIHSDSLNTINGAAADDKRINFFVSKRENNTGSAPGTLSELESLESCPEPAKLIAVNKNISADPSKINASSTIGGNTGNGDRALLIEQIQSTRMGILDLSNPEKYKYMDNGVEKTYTGREIFKNSVQLDLNQLKMTSEQSGSTMDNYFKDTIANLGVLNQEAKRMVVNQGALISQLETRKESVSGVSLDEEMTNMIQFQRAYEANAKMISVIDQLLDTVVNGLLRR